MVGCARGLRAPANARLARAMMPSAHANLDSECAKPKSACAILDLACAIVKLACAILGLACAKMKFAQLGSGLNRYKMGFSCLKWPNRVFIGISPKFTPLQVRAIAAEAAPVAFLRITFRLLREIHALCVKISRTSPCSPAGILKIIGIPRFSHLAPALLKINQ